MDGPPLMNLTKHIWNLFIQFTKWTQLKQIITKFLMICSHKNNQSKLPTKNIWPGQDWSMVWTKSTSPDYPPELFYIEQLKCSETLVWDFLNIIKDMHWLGYQKLLIKEIIITLKLLKLLLWKTQLLTSKK